MSWDSYEYERPCACGKGKILVTIESNDWGNSRCFEKILCDECKEVAESKAKIKEERSKRYSILASNVILYFREKYLNLWTSYFEDVKTKKGIWQILYHYKIENCSLPTFNKRFRIENKLNYLEKLIRLEYIPIIIKVLNINDLELEEMISEPLSIYNQLKDEQLVEYMRNL